MIITAQREEIIDPSPDRQSEIRQARTNIGKLPTIHEATHIISIEFLWERFNLPGEPAQSCLSPFRSESRPSFSVYQGDDGRSRFNDFGSVGDHGDSFDFFVACTKHDRSTAALEFRRLAAQVLTKKRREESNQHGPARGIRAARQLSASERIQMILAARTLESNEVLQESFTRSRGWKATTLQALAADGSLGWVTRGLAFIYPTGMKVRWKQNNRRQIRWVFGNAQSLWREHRIEKSDLVYITEGETDCITLVDAGLEESSNTAVVALPSATSCPPQSLRLMHGKEIVLCMDADEAGTAAEARLIDTLHSCAATLKRIDLEAALNE